MRKLPLLLVVFLSACAATVGTSGTTYIPSDARQTCQGHCSTIGMELGAVAIMANEVGCVCRVPGEARPVAAESAVTGGMATIMMQRAALARQQQQQQQQKRR